MDGSRGAHSPGWRQVAVSALVSAVLLGGAYAWQRAGGAPTAPGAFTIAMADYTFSPARMVWRVGEQVTITLVERSQATPPRSHEFMIGRTPRTEETVFGLRQGDGFEIPFFSGVTIEIVSGAGLQMLMPGEAVLTGLAPMQVMAKGPMPPMETMRANAFMPVIGPRGSLTFSFTVPDMPGEWTYGCFQQSGQHFLNGMKGTIVVLPKTA